MKLKRSEEIKKLVKEILNNINKSKSKKNLKISDDQKLFSGKISMDSVSIVKLAVILEEKINTKYKKNLNILDEFSNNIKINTINDLSKYLDDRINEKN